MRTMNKLVATLAILSFLFMFGMVKSSHGFEVTSMSADNGASGCYVSLTADENIGLIDWYIDNEHVYTSIHRDGIRSVYENIGYLPGSPFGKTYTIEAFVCNRNDFCQSDPYDLTVYTYPVKDEITSGNWTMATLYGEVDVGWNGTTAEAKAYGKITNYTPYDITYGIRIQYLVGRLQNDGWLAQQLDVPNHLLIDLGVIKANAADNDRDYSYSDSYTLSDGGRPGHEYIVEAEVTITAQIVGGDPNQIDQLPVREQQKLPIPRPE